MTLHILKTDPDVFFSSRGDLKNFEIRLNDRNFRPGDTLLLKETKFSGEQMKNGKPLEYTGRTINSEVNYILHSGYGLAKGWVILDVTHTKFESHLDKAKEMFADNPVYLKFYEGLLGAFKFGSENGAVQYT